VEGWQIGLIIVVVLGLAAIVFGAVRDRRLNERRRREMLAPPQRSIPKFSPDSPTPDYLSELQARRPPPGSDATALTDEARRQLREAIAQPDAITVDVGCASTDLITDPETGWSVLRRPSVLVSSAPISVVRELLGILEKQVPTGRPLVVVAPAIGQELISTFEVNHIQQVITILPIVATEEATRIRIAEVTGATQLSHGDLQSGFNVPGLLGSCSTWISTRRRSHLLRDSAAKPAPDTEDLPTNG
jgi:hypothetical protein